MGRKRKLEVFFAIILFSLIVTADRFPTFGQKKSAEVILESVAVDYEEILTEGGASWIKKVRGINPLTLFRPF